MEKEKGRGQESTNTVRRHLYIMHPSTIHISTTPPSQFVFGLDFDAFDRIDGDRRGRRDACLVS
jgi:hypothetical protein